MDYPVWKKKSKTPQFLDFLKACQLDPPKVSITSATTTTTSTPTNNSLATASTSNPSSSFTVQAQSLAAVGVSGGQQQLQHRVLPGGGRMAGVSGQRSGSSAAAATSASSTPSAAAAGLPHGAEIKIPGVGATPVAVSTTLPAAVVQLSQQGMCPFVMCLPFHLNDIFWSRFTYNSGK